MLRYIWGSVDRFSLPYFKYIVNKLQGIEVVDEFNEDVVVDVLQSIVEIVTYGDKHDPSIFECFMEHQGLAEFVRVLKISRNAKIETSVLQYLSIMIQNLQSEYAIYYCFSNGYLNSIIMHEYQFNTGDLALYYVSFLRAMSGRLNRDTLCLLATVQEGVVTSFPLYTEAVRFAYHGEKMIQTAIRSLTLSIYNVCDDMVWKFLTTPPVSQYFTDVILKLREVCIHIDTSVCTTGDSGGSDKRKELNLGIDILLDDLYYIKDLLGVGNSCLKAMVIKKLFSLLVVPIVMPLVHSGENSGINMSPVTSLYILSCLLQVVDTKEMVDCVASLILYSHVASIGVLANEAQAVERSQLKSSSVDVNKVVQIVISSVKSEESVGDKLRDYVMECKVCDCHSFSGQLDSFQESKGIFSYIFLDNQGLQLASLMFLLVLAESKDLDYFLASVIGFPPMKSESCAAVCIQHDRAILFQCMPQILHALLKILGSGSTISVLTRWHAGWFLLKLTSLLRVTLSCQDMLLFNASFLKARQCLLNELNGYWFDYVPDTFQQEWTSCITALEVSCRKKDPYFFLEAALNKESSDVNDMHMLEGNNADVWQRMVDAVKIFVLHLQLKAYISNCRLMNDPSKNLRSNLVASPRSIYGSDASSAKFGSQVPLGSGIPCKIAFSEIGVKDVFLMPETKGISGKLLLVEKHPFHSRSGIVLATAPLAGLTLQVDEEHGTWLHLCIRDFNPKHLGKQNNSNSNHVKDTRWTLGFSDVMACEAACLLIAEESSKQRSFVENLLAPFLHDDYLGEEAGS